MKHLVYAIALMVIPTLAMAQSLGFNTPEPASDLTLPSNYDVIVPAGPDTDGGLAPFQVVEFLVGPGNAAISSSGYLTVSKRARLLYTYWGSEAAATNTAITPANTLSLNTMFNTATSSVGDTAMQLSGPGVINFAFCSNGTGGAAFGCIRNGGTADDVRMALGISNIFKTSRGNDSAFFLFGDGAGDSDFDDMVVQVEASTVPIPAGLPLLVTAAGALALLRRFKT